MSVRLYADCDLISTGNIPLPDLGNTLYQGFTGGMYPDGKNARPDAHHLEGIRRAELEVVPRALDGLVDPVNGVIVMISVGMSNTFSEFAALLDRIETDLSVNPQLVLINGAQGGEPSTSWVDPTAPTWDEVDSRLDPDYSPLQVQVAWVKQAQRFAGPFPEKANALQSDLEAIARNLKIRYPNIQLAFVSSRTRAYITTGLSPEPTAYETGFAVKWMLEEQLLQPGALDLTVAPWLSWGPYLWADGLDPRSDGFIWECTDTTADFTHPSTTGQQLVADQSVAFFKTDPTTRPWFLRPATDPPVIESALATPSSGPAPLDVQLSSSASDLDGIADYLWTFGDGTFSNQQNPAKKFSAGGQHRAHLTVTDSLGDSSSIDILVGVGEDVFTDGFELGNTSLWSGTIP